MEITIQNLEALPKAVDLFLEYIGTSKVIAFYGEIGAGKTTFIKALCSRLGVRENVSSPTFSIINEYIYSSTAQKSVYHMDLYRLKTLDEAIDIGIEDYLYGNQYCLIEWPNIVEPLLPNDSIKINLSICDNSSRKIVFL